MYNTDSLYFEVIPVGPLKCNCSIIGNKITGQAMVIDPGGDEQKIINILNNNNLKLTVIIHTHAHFDHFLASGQLKNMTGASLYLHPDDMFLWRQLELQCQLFNIPYVPVPDPDWWLRDQQEFDDFFSMRCIHTPGHSPGSMSFFSETLKLLVAGDTLFKEGIGRTDLWGGSTRQIKTSIKNKLFALHYDSVVIPGHGPFTTIKHEIEYNHCC